MSTSAFGVDHGGISKANERKKNAAVGVGAGAATTAVLAGTKLPEHSHYSKETRAHLKSLPAGVHEVDTAMLAKKPRKLGARKQQTPYVAAMAQGRPTPYAPVPVTRYKDGIIQRDSAHSVMANAMKGRKTTIKIEDAPGYRPSRRTGEELVRRGQARYQQRRLKQNTGLSEKKINSIAGRYKESSRKANTTKRPHGVVEEGFKLAKKPYGVARALSIAKKDDRRSTASGALGAAGVGTLAATPVRRSAAKVNVSGGSMSAKSAKKVLSPGYRPGNKKAIQTMAANMGHLENKPTTVVQFKDRSVIPFDGNHRGTARVARGDAKVPVKVIQGGERPTTSAAGNAYHVAQQRFHRNRMDRGVFGATATTGKHTGERKLYSAIANGSPARSGRRVALESSRFAQGPSKAVLRTKQGATLAAGAGLLGAAHKLHQKGRR